MPDPTHGLLAYNSAKVSVCALTDADAGPPDRGHCHDSINGPTDVGDAGKSGSAYTV